MEICIINKSKIIEHIDKELKPFANIYKKKFIAHNILKFATEYVKRVYLESDKNWYNVGKNHKSDTLCLSREVDCEEWFIEVNSAEDLFGFLDTLELQAICGRYDYDNNVRTIYLYDWINY